VLARASGRKNRLVHIRKDFDRNEGEHGRFDCTDQITNRLYGFLRWKIRRHQILASMHHFVVYVISLLSFLYSLLCSKKQEESSPKIKNYFLLAK
jgi:hypothetical protein